MKVYAMAFLLLICLISGDIFSTPLHSAVSNGFIDKIETLLKARLYDINTKDFAGNTPLHKAVYECSTNSNIGEEINIFKLLLDYRADINQRNNEGNSPLLYALCIWQDKSKFALSCSDKDRYIYFTPEPYLNHEVERYNIYQSNAQCMRYIIKVVKIILSRCRTANLWIENKQGLKALDIIRDINDEEINYLISERMDEQLKNIFDASIKQ